MSSEGELKLGAVGQSGKVNPDNFKAGVKKEEFEGKQQLIFEKLDDGDGVIENAELGNLKEQISVFAEDGKITKKEARKFLKQNGLRGKKGREFAKAHGMKGQVKVKDAYEMLKNYEVASEKIDDVKEFDGSMSIKYKPDAEGTVRTDMLDTDDGKKFADIVETKDGTKTTTEYSGDKIDRQAVEKDGVKTTTTFDEDGKVELKSVQKGAVTEFFDGSDKITGRDTDLGGGNIKKEEFIYNDKGEQVRSITKDPVADVVTTSDFAAGKEVKRTEEFGDGRVVVGDFADGSEVKRVETSADGKTVTTIEFLPDKQKTTIAFEGKNIQQRVVKDGAEYVVDYDGNGNTLGVIVQNGESPAAVAKKFGVTKEALMEANKDLLKGKAGHQYFLVGQPIRIPGEIDADKFAEMNAGRKSSAEAIQDYKNAMALKRQKQQEQQQQLVSKLTPEEVRKYTVSGLKDMLGQAQADLKAQLDADGWAGKVADRISILWGSRNRESVVKSDLRNFENQLQRLEDAKDENAFKQQFKIMYGMDYNEDNVRAWLENPTGGNYKRAFGTQNDMARRVSVYNKSQQRGAGAVKGVTAGVVMVAATAAAIPTGGTSLAAGAGIAFGIGAGTAAAVEISDRATNNIDNSKDIYSKQAVKEIAVESTVSGALNTVFWGAGSVMGGGAKVVTTSTTRAALPAAETGSRLALNPATETGARLALNPATETGARLALNPAAETGARAALPAAERTATEIVQDAGKGVTRTVTNGLEEYNGHLIYTQTVSDVAAGTTARAGAGAAERTAAEIVQDAGKGVTRTVTNGIEEYNGKLIFNQTVTDIEHTVMKEWGASVKNISGRLAKLPPKTPVNLTASEVETLESVLGINKGSLLAMNKEQLKQLIKHASKRPNLVPELQNEVLTILNRMRSGMV